VLLGQFYDTRMAAAEPTAQSHFATQTGCWEGRPTDTGRTNRKAGHHHRPDSDLLRMILARSMKPWRTATPSAETSPERAHTRLARAKRPSDTADRSCRDRDFDWKSVHTGVACGGPGSATTHARRDRNDCVPPLSFLERQSRPSAIRWPRRRSGVPRSNELDDVVGGTEFAHVQSGQKTFGKTNGRARMSALWCRRGEASV